MVVQYSRVLNGNLVIAYTAIFHPLNVHNIPGKQALIP